MFFHRVGCVQECSRKLLLSSNKALQPAAFVRKPKTQNPKSKAQNPSLRRALQPAVYVRAPAAEREGGRDREGEGGRVGRREREGQRQRVRDRVRERLNG
jgi:hypothetical protein